MTSVLRSPLNASALYTRYLYGSGLLIIYLKRNRRRVTKDVKRGGVVLNEIFRWEDKDK